MHSKGWGTRPTPVIRSLFWSEVECTLSPRTTIVIVVVVVVVVVVVCKRRTIKFS